MRYDPPEPKGKLDAMHDVNGGVDAATVNGPEDGSSSGTPSTGGPRGGGTAATAADLQGGAGAGLAQGQESAEADAAEPVEHAGQRAAGDAAQRWAQDGGDRRGGRVDLRGQGEVAVRVHWSVRLGSPARSSACTSRRHQTRKTESARNSGDHGRCHQARVRNALEPEWEARFEPRSYGFRPGRGCHDAIKAIYAVCKGPRLQAGVDA